MSNRMSNPTPFAATSKPAVVLVSGGMDSAVVMAIAREQGFAVNALSVRYGQRHTSELDAAATLARTLGAADIFCGVNAVDYSGYPDCRPEFIEAFERLANLATKAGVEGAGIRIHAPLQHMSKADIVREGGRLGVDFADTVSCYKADEEGRACGHCDACRLRAEGFKGAGAIDPTRYR